VASGLRGLLSRTSLDSSCAAGQAEEVCQSSARVPGVAMLEPDEQVIILASPPRNLKCIQNDFSQGQLEPAGDLSRCAVADRRVLLGTAMAWVCCHFR
jgi:hypothetical protein